MLDKIGNAMGLWEGRGQINLMQAGRLKRHKAQKENPNGKKRLRTFQALFGAARVIHESFGTLRKLLASEE
eukprot:5987639-Prymnesium_polylepis.1